MDINMQTKQMLQQVLVQTPKGFNSARDGQKPYQFFEGSSHNQRNPEYLDYLLESAFVKRNKLLFVKMHSKTIERAL